MEPEELLNKIIEIGENNSICQFQSSLLSWLDFAVKEIRINEYNFGIQFTPRLPYHPIGVITIETIDFRNREILLHFSSGSIDKLVRITSQFDSRKQVEE